MAERKNRKILRFDTTDFAVLNSRVSILTQSEQDTVSLITGRHTTRSQKAQSTRRDDKFLGSASVNRADQGPQGVGEIVGSNGSY
ncbi:hypothetical protein RRG08_027972 [Elysia crispata]|uniref:Uncharacterized protein n=1 Tax=Elysia crispata TaxID=231223 RepID=A0AAE1DH47_9GAST|nr:hypothetical protein RRG08_027972 [Elysia crispata]